MKSGMLSFSDAEGKTVKTILEQGYGESILISFTDGSYLSLTAEGDDDCDAAIELRLRPCLGDFSNKELHELGIISDEEFETAAKEASYRLAQEAKDERQARYDQYRKLREEFEVTAQ